jgi:hypothetical protein
MILGSGAVAIQDTLYRYEVVRFSILDLMRSPENVKAI